MQLRAVRSGLGALLAALAVIVFAAPSVAKGVVRVQQGDGTVKYYRDARLRLHANTLRIVSADGWGTIVVRHAACMTLGQLMRCLPYSLALDQNHVTRTLGFSRGAIYVNTSGSAQSLPHSSTQLPPNGVVLSIVTERGTYISVRGTLDEVAQ
jgi:hypothetical protein